MVGPCPEREKQMSPAIGWGKKKQKPFQLIYEVISKVYTRQKMNPSRCQILFGYTPPDDHVGIWRMPNTTSVAVVIPKAG